MDLTTYGIFELTNTISEDQHAVRSEVERRSDKLAKQIIRMKAKLEKAQKEQDELFSLYRKVVAS